jgi:tetratricopeptide (TPR) repeat protein
MASMIARMASQDNLRLAFALSFLVMSSGCAKEEANKDLLLSRANDYFIANQYEKAEKEYREVLRLASTDPVALRRLGIIYHDQGQLPQAYPYLKQAAELNPDDPEVHLKLGLTLLAFRQFAEARDAALQALDKEPGQEQAVLLLADTAVPPASSIEETRGLIESRRAQDRDRPGYHLALGTLHLRQQDGIRAESEFKAALDLDPKSGSGHVALGLLYWSRNDLKAAEQEFKTAADLAPPRSPMRLRYADFLMKTGSTSEAKAVLEEINHKAPDYLPPRVYLMKIVCAKQQDQDCATRAQNILAQDSLNYDALLQDGVLNLAKGDAVKAIREFEQLSNLYNRNPQVRYQLALAYLQFANSASPVDSRKAVESADSNLDTAVKLAPQFEQALLLLADLKIRKGSPAAAVDLLVPLIKDRPQVTQAHYLLGTAYLAQQNRDQALAVYRQMSELFQQDPQPPYLSGTILLAQGRQAEAREAFEKSVGISPNHLSAIERLVDLDIAERKYVAAMDRIQRQIDRDPKLAQPWAIRGKIYFAQRDFGRAEGDLLKSTELDPNLESAHLLFAQLYVASNKPEKAIEKLNAFLEKHKTVPALLGLAEIHEQLKNYSAARDAYEKVLTVNANFAVALNNLAVIYSEQLGQLDKAFDLAKRAREVAPNEPRMADTLGWIQFNKGEYGSALQLLQESAGKLPDQSEIQFHVGMAHYMLGQEEPARVALQKAADAKADFRGKEEAHRRLGILRINAATANAPVRKELEDYLRERPNDPAALVRFAQTQERDGAPDQALKTYEKVVDGNPQFSPALRQLVVIYGQRSVDNPKAYDLALKARQAFPQDSDVAKTLGILSYRRELYPRAAELLREAAAKQKDDSELLYYLGETHRQLKQWNECKAALQGALSLNLSPARGDMARRALADCSEASPP